MASSLRASAFGIKQLVSKSAQTSPDPITDNVFNEATVSNIQPGKELRGEVVEWVFYITRRDGSVVRASFTEAS